MTNVLFNTSHFVTDLAKKDFAAMITRLMPQGMAPLFGLTGMLNSKTAINFEHGFFTKTMVFPEMQINNGAGYVAGITTFTVDSTANLLPNMIMRNERTGENVIINTVPDATSVTVAREVGTVAAAAILDNDVWYEIGNAFEEASVRPDAHSIDPVRVTNLTQIFRNTWAISGSAEAVEVIAGDSTDAENRQDCAGFHAAAIEKSLFFGQKSQVLVTVNRSGRWMGLSTSSKTPPTTRQSMLVFPTALALLALPTTVSWKQCSIRSLTSQLIRRLPTSDFCSLVVTPKLY